MFTYELRRSSLDSLQIARQCVISEFGYTRYPGYSLHWVASSIVNFFKGLETSFSSLFKFSVFSFLGDPAWPCRVLPLWCRFVGSGGPPLSPHIPRKDFGPTPALLNNFVQNNFSHFFSPYWHQLIVELFMHKSGHHCLQGFSTSIFHKFSHSYCSFYIMFFLLSKQTNMAKKIDRVPLDPLYL